MASVTFRTPSANACSSLPAALVRQHAHSGSRPWLDRGTTHRLDRGFAAFEVWRDAKLEDEEADRRKLDRRIEDEEHWMRYGVTARRKRNMRRVGELADLRSERREALRSVGVAAMIAQDTKASGALVIDAEQILSLIHI